MIFETICVGGLQVNCYILASQEGSRAIIIDPGADEARIKKALAKHKLSPAFIINTHGHFDHIGCDDKFGVPIYAYKDEVGLLIDPERNLSSMFFKSYAVKSEIKPLKEGEIVKLDDIELEVIHTPGHSQGGMSLLMKKPRTDILFTGDSLFFQSIGRTDFPGADETTLIDSIKDKLLSLPDNTIVYPGHGPSSTIEKERNSNPYLR